jgi:hypothetical protein
MKKRVELFINYLKNNRVSEYENIIKKALDKEYEVISLRDYIEERYDKKKKLLVLRHDVDNRSLGEKKIFEVEQRYGVKSSFYFRNSTFNPTFMREIESYGSEASLHFEPIADFVKANDVFDSSLDVAIARLNTALVKLDSMGSQWDIKSNIHLHKLKIEDLKDTLFITFSSSKALLEPLYKTAL